MHVHRVKCHSVVYAGLPLSIDLVFSQHFLPSEFVVSLYFSQYTVKKTNREVGVLAVCAKNNIKQNVWHDNLLPQVLFGQNQMNIIRLGKPKLHFLGSA